VDAYLDLAITNFAGSGGNALSTEVIDAPYCYGTCGGEEIITYSVYRDGDPTPIVTGLENTSYVDMGLSYNETHCYYVTEVVDDVESYPSNTACATSWPEGGPVPGCMDPTAINYDPAANYEDDSCVYFNMPLQPVDGEEIPFTNADTYDNPADFVFDWTGSVVPEDDVCGYTLYLHSDSNDSTVVIGGFLAGETVYVATNLEIAEYFFLYDDDILNFSINWWVEVCLDSGTYQSDEFTITINTEFLGNDTPVIIPESFTLSQNFPNPFNPETQIEFGIPEISHVTLTIYDLSGREVQTLIDREMLAGTYRVDWDGMDMNNQLVPTGVYIYIMNSGNDTVSKKMVMMK